MTREDSVRAGFAMMLAAGLCTGIGVGHAVELTITSAPSGAEVTLNGERAGQTPLTLDVSDTDVKQCELALAKPGFLPARLSFTLVLAAGRFQGLHFPLMPEGDVAPPGSTPPATPAGPSQPEGPAVVDPGPPPPPRGREALAQWMAGFMSLLRMLPQ